MVRRTKEEAQETRSQILEAAEKAFYERGVARTTLADIATLAGVTRGCHLLAFQQQGRSVAGHARHLA
jgi:hypothetical protein